MLPTAKDYGVAYKAVADLIGTYYGGRKCGWLYADKLRSAMLAMGKNLKATNENFPMTYYSQMCSIVGKWFEEGFVGLMEQEIQPSINGIFKLHKAYLDVELTDEVVDKLLKESNQRVSDRDSYMGQMYLCMLQDLDAREKKRQEAA